MHIFSRLAVQGSVAWSTQTVSGKLYAPELADETLDDLLQYFKPHGVVMVRRMFQDPNRSHAPFFVLTFLGTKCPPSIKAGYSIYKIDTYYPSPPWCSQCCRWGHIKKNCHGTTTCSQCSAIGHSYSNCPSPSTKCRNCSGNHTANSKQCPIYLEELEICKYKTDNRLSYSEAKQQLQQTGFQNPPSQKVQPNRGPKQIPDINSWQTFPMISDFSTSKQPNHSDPAKETTQKPISKFHPTLRYAINGS